jgi:hypothetical protein
VMITLPSLLLAAEKSPFYFCASPKSTLVPISKANRSCHLKVFSGSLTINPIETGILRIVSDRFH